MKEEQLNSFLTPAKLVWEEELGEDLQVVSANLVSSQFTTDDVTAIIGVSGKLEGNVLYGFTEDTALAVVSKMLDEKVSTVSTELGLSVLDEIANS